MKAVSPLSRSQQQPRKLPPRSLPCRSRPVPRDEVGLAVLDQSAGVLVVQKIAQGPALEPQQQGALGRRQVGTWAERVRQAKAPRTGRKRGVCPVHPWPGTRPLALRPKE